MTTCNPCPYGISSFEGSDTCPFCAEGFYLKNSTALPQEIFQNPSENCLQCPLGTYDSTGPDASASSIDDCLPCTSGTFANKTGENNRSFHVCSIRIVVFNCFVTSSNYILLYLRHENL